MIKKTVIQEAVDNAGFGYYRGGKTALIRVNASDVNGILETAEVVDFPVRVYHSAKDALAEELAEDLLCSKSMELKRTSEPTEEEKLLADEVVINKRFEVAQTIKPYLDQTIGTVFPAMVDVVEKHVFQNFTAEVAHSIGFDESNEAWAHGKDEAMGAQTQMYKDVVGDNSFKPIFRNVRGKMCPKDPFSTDIKGNHPIRHFAGTTEECFITKW